MTVEQWDIFELTLPGRSEGNPFLEVEVAATFASGDQAIAVEGFYDGDGMYRVRFMPPTVGRWSFRTASNSDALDGQKGEFYCIPATGRNHGPVGVVDTFQFAYADGTSFRPFGTTCYAWIHQDLERQEETLRTLQEAPFNKLRMCVFPKHYEWNENEPTHYPFQVLDRGRSEFVPDYANIGSSPEPSGWSFDFERFDPTFFGHLEDRIRQLGEQGVEADLILFHPYDRWGFATMSAEVDERYLRYVVARLAAYRNIWWSMANEYDLVFGKSIDRWNQLLAVLQECDIYAHLRSIHNWMKFYDHSSPAVTHVSAQHDEVSRAAIWREQYQKPVIVDECGYEGDIAYLWGNLSARELVHRTWTAICHGAYLTHGETYLGDYLWWSHGGTLKGESPPRIDFLRQLLEESPAAFDPVPNIHSGLAMAGPRESLTLQDLIDRFREGHDMDPQGEDPRVMAMFPGIQQPHEYYLLYTGDRQPSHIVVSVPSGEWYRADVIDTWEMTITPLSESVMREDVVPMPGRPYQALRLQRIRA